VLNQVDAFRISEELDDLTQDLEYIESDDNEKAIKVIFNKLFDYDPAFRRLSYTAVSLIFGILLHDRGDMAHKLDILLRGGIKEISNITEGELKKMEKEEGEDNG
jgi:hypothetical protein